jgi:serine/threonine-protein kinase
MSFPTETPDERVGLILRDKWRLERLLGVGGMASVYLARHEIGRYDAIKILHEQYADNAGVRARFEREARAVNHFRHPGAVEIRDIDTTEDGSPFLVMEYLEGEPLQERLRRGTIPMEQLLEIVSDVLDVLGAAHDQRIIHRDIKPANIFLLEDGRVKVLDFGIARMREAAGTGTLTEEGAMLGTGGYMPPEQILGEEIDRRADLFAVGATMFRIISGRRVQQANSHSDLLVRMATEPAPRLGTVAPNAPEGVCKIVDLALAFDPEGRYPDAATMQQDVRAVQMGEPPPYASAIFAGDLDAADTARRAARAGRESSSRGGRTQLRSRPRVSAAERMEGRVVNGRYRLDSLIGKGGMGAVYAATHLEADHQVAIKLVLSHLASPGSSTPGRFRREASATASLDSENVVRVIDADVDEEGVPFLVMDLLEGRDLERWLDQVRPLAQDAAARVFVQACRGVAAAHQKGIVHRDIKPANLFLSKRSDGELVVKVLDFGLAKQRSREETSTQASLTETGGVLGTPRYASPEQVKNAKLVDRRSDVWSLCMTMYEALSGLVPWNDCEAVGEIIIAIATTDVAPLTEVAPWVDPALAAIIDKGLQRDPDARWQSATELLEALEGITTATALVEQMLAGHTSSMSLQVGGVASTGALRQALPSSRSVPGVGGTLEGAPRRSRFSLAVAGLAVVAVGGAIAVTALRSGAPDTDAATAPPSSGEAAAPSPSSLPPATDDTKSEPSAMASGAASADAAPSVTASASARPQAAKGPRVAARPPPPSSKPDANKPPAPTSSASKPPPKLELKTEW